MKLGIIGAGVVVANRHSEIIKNIAGIQPVWVYDKSQERAEHLARKFADCVALPSLSQTPRADAILIATPVGTRAPFWDLAFQNKWSVFCEKPLSTSLAELETII